MGKVTLNKKSFLIILIIAFVAAGSIALFIFLRDTEDTSKTQPISYSDMCVNDDVGLRLKSEFPQFTADAVGKIDRLINEIDAIPGVDESINCQFVLAKYDSFTGDIVSSADHYAKVIALYETDQKWIESIIGIETIDDVRVLEKYYRDISTRATSEEGKIQLISPIENNENQ